MLPEQTTRIADPSRTAWAPDIKGKTKLLYTVKEGDNLGSFRNGTGGIVRLRYWNNITATP